MGDLRPGRERRRGRHRRRPGGDLQDGEPQPPVATSSPIRARRRASAASCATCSRWARGRSPTSTRCASAGPTTRRCSTSSPAWSQGIGGYGNCVGVPTVGGEANFHAAYDGNILVNAMTVGVAEPDKIFYSAATGVGNPIVYVGAKTGRDGIHGATMASAEFAEDADAKRPTVQVGDPFTEKLLIEACLELMATDAIVAIQDMGAAGLTSLERRDGQQGRRRHRPRHGQGAAPRRRHDALRDDAQREPGAHAHGAQARPRGAMAEAIFRKWELDFAVIGEVTDTGHMVLEWQGEVVCDIPLGPLADDAPLYDRPAWRRRTTAPGRGSSRSAMCRRPPTSARTCSSCSPRPTSPAARWIWQQYDSQVGADTLQLLRRRRRRGARARQAQGAGHDDRLHAALLLCRPLRGRQAGGRRGLPQPLRGRRAAAGGDQLPELRQSRAARDHGASSPAASKAWAPPAARSTSRS